MKKTQQRTAHLEYITAARKAQSTNPANHSATELKKHQDRLNKKLEKTKAQVADYGVIACKTDNHVPASSNESSQIKKARAKVARSKTHSTPSSSNYGLLPLIATGILLSLMMSAAAAEEISVQSRSSRRNFIPDSTPSPSPSFNPTPVPTPTRTHPFHPHPISTPSPSPSPISTPSPTPTPTPSVKEYQLTQLISDCSKGASVIANDGLKRKLVGVRNGDDDDDGHGWASEFIIATSADSDGLSANKKRANTLRFYQTTDAKRVATFTRDAQDEKHDGRPAHTSIVQANTVLVGSLLVGTSQENIEPLDNSDFCDNSQPTSPPTSADYASTYDMQLNFDPNFNLKDGAPLTTASMNRIESPQGIPTEDKMDVTLWKTSLPIYFDDADAIKVVSTASKEALCTIQQQGEGSAAIDTELDVYSVIPQKKVRMPEHAKLRIINGGELNDYQVITTEEGRHDLILVGRNMQGQERVLVIQDIDKKTGTLDCNLLRQQKSGWQEIIFAGQRKGVLNTIDRRTALLGIPRGWSNTFMLSTPDNAKAAAYQIDLAGFSGSINLNTAPESAALPIAIENPCVETSNPAECNFSQTITMTQVPVNNGKYPTYASRLIVGRSYRGMPIGQTQESLQVYAYPDMVYGHPDTLGLSLLYEIKWDGTEGNYSGMGMGHLTTSDDGILAASCGDNLIELNLAAIENKVQQAYFSPSTGAAESDYDVQCINFPPYPAPSPSPSPTPTPTPHTKHQPTPTPTPTPHIPTPNPVPTPHSRITPTPSPESKAIGSGAIIAITLSGLAGLVIVCTGARRLCSNGHHQEEEQLGDVEGSGAESENEGEAPLMSVNAEGNSYGSCNARARTGSAIITLHSSSNVTPALSDSHYDIKTFSSKNEGRYDDLMGKLEMLNKKLVLFLNGPWTQEKSTGTSFLSGEIAVAKGRAEKMLKEIAAKIEEFKKEHEENCCGIRYELMDEPAYIDHPREQANICERTALEHQVQNQGRGLFTTRFENFNPNEHLVICERTQKNTEVLLKKIDDFIADRSHKACTKIFPTNNWQWNEALDELELPAVKPQKGFSF